MLCSVKSGESKHILVQTEGPHLLQLGFRSSLILHFVFHLASLPFLHPVPQHYKQHFFRPPLFHMTFMAYDYVIEHISVFDQMLCTCFLPFSVWIYMYRTIFFWSRSPFLQSFTFQVFPKMHFPKDKQISSFSLVSAPKLKFPLPWDSDFSRTLLELGA